MRRECQERFPRHRLQRKLLVSDPGMHHDTCVTHVPWCMSESLTRSGRENVPGIPSAWATRDFTYLVRGLWHDNHKGIVIWSFDIYVLPLKISAFQCAVYATNVSITNAFPPEPRETTVQHKLLKYNMTYGKIAPHFANRRASLLQFYA